MLTNQEQESIWFFIQRSDSCSGKVSTAVHIWINNTHHLHIKT